jgi:hypothetical protein
VAFAELGRALAAGVHSSLSVALPLQEAEDRAAD